MYKYKDEDGSIGLHISIGEFDCDDCGWTSENLEVRVETRDGKPIANSYSTSMTLGCYSGFSNYEQTFEDTMDKLIELRNEYPFNSDKSTLKELNEIIRTLESL